jgi:hypothetical protein
MHMKGAIFIYKPWRAIVEQISAAFVTFPPSIKYESFRCCRNDTRNIVFADDGGPLSSMWVGSGDLNPILNHLLMWSCPIISSNNVSCLGFVKGPNNF